ncbi:hypothetical protein [Mammaliicoccus lentus]|nr:hypothetical protein [Mammaliicoccus lentus]
MSKSNEQKKILPKIGEVINDFSGVNLFSINLLSLLGTYSLLKILKIE